MNVGPRIALGGIALHEGVPVSVVLERRTGPIALEQRDLQTLWQDWEIARADRGVEVVVRENGMRIDLMEHFAASIGALGIQRCLRIRVNGNEMPLLDGGAATWGRALRQLDVPTEPYPCWIARNARYELGDSRYDFEPSESTRIVCEVSFPHPQALKQSAEWDGTVARFLDVIAPARTFGFLEDADALRATARAQGASLSSVVVLTRDGGCLSCPTMQPDELARHKLLDLIGDFTLAGGMPRGMLRAYRPGHARNHAVWRQAVEDGVIIGRYGGRQRIA